MKQQSSFPVFIQFLLSHFLLVLMFVAGLLVINLSYSSVIRAMVTNISMNELEKTAEVFDTRLQEIESSAYLIAHQRTVSLFALADKPTIEQYEKIQDLDTQMESAYISNDFLEDVILWFHHSGTVWSSFQRRQSQGSGFLDAKMLEAASDTFSVDGRSITDFFDALNMSGRMSVLQYANLRTSSAEGAQRFLYSINLQPLSSGKIHGWITYILDPEQVLPLLSFAAYQGTLTLLMNDGTEVYPGASRFSFAGRQEIDCSDSYSYFTYSPSASRLTYRLGIPSSYIMENMWSAQKTSIFIAILIAMITIGLSLFFSRKHAEPVHKLASLTVTATGNKNEYSAIFSSVTNLLHNQQVLQQKLEQQTLLQRNAVFSKLMAYEFRSEEQLLDALANVGIYPDAEQFVAVHIRLHVPDEHDSPATVPILLSELVPSTVNGLLGIYPMLHSRYALFCQLSQQQSLSMLCQQLTTLVEIVRREMGLPMNCVIGSPVAELIELSESFQSTRKQVRQYDPMRDDSVLFVCQNEELSPRVMLSESFRHRMISLCLSGEESTLTELTSKTLLEHSASDSVDKLDLLQLGYDLRGLLLHLSEQISMPSDGFASSYAINHLPSASSYETLCAETLSILHAFCEAVNNQRQTAARQIHDQVYAYITEHFADPELSLTSIANHVNMNEKYLSQLYKREGGQNLTTDIEMLRMTHAIDLMENQKMKSLEEIAVACGYSNLNTFYKAFKRIYGMAPGLYRKQLYTKN